MQDKQAALKETEKILGYIFKDQLTDADKDQIVKDSVDNFNNYINPGWIEYRKSMSTNEAFVEWSDHDCVFEDVYGNEFIDCLGGFGIFILGHKHPAVQKAMNAQLNRYALHSQELLDPLRGYLANALAKATPGDLQYSFFCNGGAEAVEIAIKLARLATGKRWYISTVNGFHGKSFGAVSMTGKGTYRKPYLPMIQQVQHVEYNNAQQMEDAIKNLIAVGETVAGVIIEPLQGEAGCVLPEPGYLKAVREICDKYEVALIFDEIQTGMGRTGYLWACESEGVVPDIMTFGKSFGGGMAPITGIIARPWCWNEEIVENPWILGSPTFGGNPLVCSAAIAALDYIIRNDIPKMAMEKGEYFLGKLQELQKKHSKIMTTVRGRGMLMCMEFADSNMGYSVAKGMFSRKVMTAGTLNNAKAIRLEPPAIMTNEMIDIVIQRLDESLADTEKEFNA